MRSSRKQTTEDLFCSCGRAFDAYVNLNRHQRKCQVYNDADTDVAPTNQFSLKRKLSVHRIGGEGPVPFKRPSLLERIRGYSLRRSRTPDHESEDLQEEVQVEDNDADVEVEPGDSELDHIDSPICTADEDMCIPELNNENLVHGDNTAKPAESEGPRRLRPRRNRVAIQDVLPQLVRSNEAERFETQSSRTKQSRFIWRTPVNKYGVYRDYAACPLESRPLLDYDLEHADSALDVIPSRANLSHKPTLAEALCPFPNISQFLWTQWYLGNPQGGMSSQHSDRFTQDVIGNPLFESRDLEGMSMAGIRDAVAKWNPSPCEPHQGWKSISVTIDVPLGKPKKGKSHPLSIPFEVPNIQVRSIVEIVRNVLAHDENVKDFMWIPYKEYQCDPVTGNRRTRIFNEAMSSNEVHRLWKQVQKSDGVPGCTAERVVLYLRWWSDATHLAQFGEHKLWPFYMCFANQPKWQCNDPNMGAWHDVAYMAQLSKTFTTFVKNARGHGPSKDLTSHCIRELYQAVINIILDDDFVEACVYGILVKFLDGIIRRVFFRILTHSADYKEKVLIALIRDMGNFPCPRCLVPKSSLGWVGQKRDLKTRNQKRISDNILANKIKRARKLIYKDGLAVRSAKVELLLKPTSLQPTENAFSTRLKDINFDVHKILAVDLLHEVEIGVWKAVLEHLVRILYALPGGNELVETLNTRFRSTAPFGVDTIRPITYNVSDFHHLAARDYEDLLQIALPCFDGLYPAQYQQGINVLIYDIADFHALAKLFTQTESTLDSLQMAIKRVGESLRWFSNNVCADVEAFETPKEAEKRRRRAAKEGSSTSKERQPRVFGLERYKLHAIGDYVEQVHLFGTLDNYNTQAGEQRHRAKKRQYEQRTSHHNYESQIAQDTVIQEKIRLIGMKISDALGEMSSNDRRRQHAVRNEEPLQVDENNKKVVVSNDESVSQSFSNFVRLHPHDSEFSPLRKQILDYLFARLTNAGYSWDEPIFTDADYNRIIIDKDNIYPHATLKVNYTTYDLHRKQDGMKSYLHILPKGKGIKTGHSPRSFVMLASEETEVNRGHHPFWYAQVLGIFHVNARLVGEPRESTKRVHFLWVKWFGHCEEHKNGAPPRGLYKVGPVRGVSASTGIINPEDVIRGAHLIPSFKDGREDTEAWEPSVIEDIEGDWIYHYVNKFVDRDMVMRHRGGGVGHIDPVQFTQHYQLDAERSGGPHNTIHEATCDSDDCSSLPEEEADSSSESSGDEDTESFEILSNHCDTGSSEQSDC